MLLETGLSVLPALIGGFAKGLLALEVGGGFGVLGEDAGVHSVFVDDSWGGVE